MHHEQVAGETGRELGDLETEVEQTGVLVGQGRQGRQRHGDLRVGFGSTEFHVVKPCARCVMTTVDQDAGEKTGKEPLATLAGYRSSSGKVLFGQNLIAESAGGVVRGGDEVEILS